MGGPARDRLRAARGRPTFTARPWPAEALASADDAADPANAVIDARQHERYLGAGPDPVDPRPGHIPGARSLPAREHLGADGRLLDRDELRARFAAAGVDGERPVVSYCGSGVTACHNLIVLEHAGLGDRPAVRRVVVAVEPLRPPGRDRGGGMSDRRCPPPSSSPPTARGERSPVEVAEAALARIEARDGELNAFCLVDADARAGRRAARRRRAGRRGEPAGPLDGVPVGVKDLLVTRGWPTLRGSRAIDPAGPWEDDAPVVASLRRSGAVLPGKTTTPELGWKGVTDSALTGVTRNPWDPRDDAGRLERRQLGGARGRDGAARARHRRRRLDPDPVRVLRAARPQADVRPRAGLAGEPVRRRSRTSGRWRARSPTSRCCST